MKLIRTDTLFDFPIQFKELNHSDFEGFLFEDEEKTIINPNTEGYISEALAEVIDLEKSDTTVINASVGQGKTTAIIDFIKWYYEQNLYNDEKYKIIIVTPFKSLNQEYIKKLKKAIGEDVRYFEYQELDIQDKNRSISTNEFYKMNSSNPIQLISAMSIMGDAGDMHWKQSDFKRRYYEYLANQCEINNEKVILFFDEIHESLRSFTSELIYNLFRWRKSAHKIFIASATFTESSKVPIKYIAELTGRRLKIIESQRIQNDDNLSELHLCFYNQWRFDPENPSFKEIIEEELANASKLNILCYSPKIAKSIYRSPVVKMLRQKFNSVNLCHPDNGKTFNEEACNIGTTFKTGISIEDENSVFIIIMPLKLSYSKKGKTQFGIFSDGINSLIQAVARPRNKSKIFVITPSPDKIILRNQNEKEREGYIEKLSLEFLSFNDEENQARYFGLNKQDTILRYQYNTLKNQKSEKIDYLANLHDELKLPYWEYDWFKLTKGDDNLRKGYDIFGKNLANYLYWAAWNNQFANCKLTSIRKSSVLVFEKGNIQTRLEKYYPLGFINDESFKENSDKALYEKLRNNIFSNNVYYDIEKEIRLLEEQGVEVKDSWDKYLKKIRKNTDSIFEQQIIQFLQRRKTPYNFKSNQVLTDVRINKVDYIRNCIAQCIPFFESAENLDSKDYLIVDAYRDLYSFKDILFNECTIKNNREDKLLPTEKNIKLRNVHIIKLRRAFSTLDEFDEVLKIFSKKNLLNDSSLLTILREVFFESSITTIKQGNRTSKYWKIKERPFPDTEHLLNLVYNTEDPWLHYPIPPELLIKYEIEEGEDWYDEFVKDSSSYFTDNDKFL